MTVMRRTVAAAAVAVLLFACAACRKPAPPTAHPIVGNWNATVDLTDFYNAELETYTEMGGYLTASSFCLLVHFTFREDGTYESEVDADSFKEAVILLRGDLETGIRNYLKQWAADTGSTKTVEQLIRERGVTMDSMIDSILSTVPPAAFAQDQTQKGYYRLAEHSTRLYLSADSIPEITPDKYTVCSGTATDFILSEYAGDPNDNPLYHTYPLTISRDITVSAPAAS